MGTLNTVYDRGGWGYMGIGPTPNDGFRLTISYYPNQKSWGGPSAWHKMGILFYKIGDTTKYAVHKTATLNVDGGKIISEDNPSQTVDLFYTSGDWDFYGGFTVNDLAGAAVCVFCKDPAGYSGSAPNGLDYSAIPVTDSDRPTFNYTILSYRFANKLDGADIYAKRAECDSDGNPINTTYATKAELAGKQDELTAGTNITIDSDGVISAAGGGGETYTAGDNITIDSDGVISADLPEEEEVEFEELDLDDYQKKLTDGTGIDLDSDGNISVDSSIATKSYVSTAVQGKQDALTGITDVQVVAALPGTPVATVLYLIPEA